MTELFRFTPGDCPVLLNVPHDGRHVPGDIAARLSEAASSLPDTDWHVRELFDFAKEFGVGVLEATHSRYVVDLNRDPDGKVLYPGADNTEICPVRTFDQAPIYLPGAEIAEGEVDDRIAR